MVIAYAYGAGTKRQTLAFMDAHIPRVGEFITLGFEYKIVKVTHRFHHQSNVPCALEDQEYFVDIPALEIELERVP